MAPTKEFPQLGIEVSRSELYNLYWVEELSQSEIADEIGISKTSVIRAFDELEVPKRDLKSANELANQKKRSERDYTDEQYLRNEYLRKTRAPSEIAEDHDVVPATIRYWLNKYDIEIRGSPYDIPHHSLCPRPESEAGYSRYPIMKGCDGQEVPVHHLVLIANGADPYNVFANPELNTDHINRHPVDNRPSNLRLVHRSEHGLKEHDMNLDLANGNYTEEEVKSAIWYMLNPSQIQNPE